MQKIHKEQKAGTLRFVRLEVGIYLGFGVWGLGFPARALGFAP
jgi:hypothetical protein